MSFDSFWGGQEHTLTGLLPNIQLASYISFLKNGYKNTEANAPANDTISIFHRLLLWSK